jgi:hypothetical protein
MAGEQAGAETIDYEDADVYEVLIDATGGRGPTPALTQSG